MLKKHPLLSALCLTLALSPLGLFCENLIEITQNEEKVNKLQIVYLAQSKEYRKSIDLYKKYSLYKCVSYDTIN